LREAGRALLLLFGSVAEDRYWSTNWTSGERVLTALTEWLQRSHAVGMLELDDGWAHDRDISLPIGRWAWLDARGLVEDHGSRKTLVRIDTHIRPTGFGLLSAFALAAAMIIAASAGVALRRPLAGATAATLAVSVAAFTAWRTAKATALLHRAVRAVTAEQG